MQFSSLKTSLWVLTFISFTAACASGSSPQSQTANNTSITAANAKQEVAQNNGMGEMNQGNGMNHNMSMDLGPADADYDLRFIDGMILHHQGAVNMAKEVLNKSKRGEMKKLATDVIAAQNQEIKEMKQWRQAWYPKADSKSVAYAPQMGHQMAMTPQQMQGMMMMGNLGAADAQFDLRFINAMIPHHQGAIAMAKDALSKSKRPEIRKLAQDIIAAQQQEIEQMQEWRKAWYKQ